MGGWIIKGTTYFLEFNISEDGDQWIKGGPNLEHRILNKTSKNPSEFENKQELFFDHLMEFKITWKIYLSQMITNKAFSRALDLKYVKEKSGQTPVIQISYLAKVLEIGVFIFLPKEHFNKTWNLLQNVLLGKDLSYDICILFNGFSDGNSPSIPTIDEFQFKNRDYFSEEVNFRIEKMIPLGNIT